MGTDDKKNIPLWARTGHQRPVTRRDFLASGLIPFSAAMILPQWVNLLLPSSAGAATCQTSSADLVPFVTLNLAGGAGLSGNYVPQDIQGNPLPSYDIMGLGAKPPIEREFGNVPFAGMNNGTLISKFLQGLRETAPTAIPKTAFIASCVRLKDDSGDNKSSIDGLVAQAGLNGGLFQNLGSAAGKSTGINAEPALVTPPPPVFVDKLSVLSSSLGYAGAIGSSLSKKQKETLATFISKLSQSQTGKVASISSGDEVKKLVDCAGIKNSDIIQAGAQGIDPRQDTSFANQLNTLWGINAGTANDAQRLVFASMVYNAIKGNAGSAALQLGGYDYHDNTRSTGDAKDLEAGRTAGQILETAAIMNKEVVLYITSDGSTSSVKSDSPNSAWSSDRGLAGVSFLLYYNPAGRAATKGFQIGYFEKEQAASDQFITGGSPETAAVAMFANYLAISKRLDLFNSIAGRTFGGSDFEKILKFG